MKDYYTIMMDICEAAKENATLGEITQIMSSMREWAKAASQKIMDTKFSCPEDEEDAVSTLGEMLLGMFDAFEIDHLKIENGTSFKFGTVFDSEHQPVFTIHGTEFYSEDGEKYDHISDIPVGRAVSYWYNNNPHGWFMKLTNYVNHKKPLVYELEKIETND